MSDTVSDTVVPRTAPRLDIGERPPLRQWPALSLQHLFAMFGATVLVPLLTGFSPAVALFTAGTGTLLYMVVTRFRVPVFLGSSFAFIAPVVAARELAGPDGAMQGAFTAGLVYLLVSASIARLGVRWLLHLLPPVVVGPVIVVIGLGLAPVAVQMATGGVGSDYSLANLAVAVFTLSVLIGFALVLRGFLSTLPVLMAVLLGYVLAAALGMVDFTPVAEASFFSTPDFTWFLTSLDGGVRWDAVLLVAPVALVTMCEHVGDQVVVSRVTGRNFLADPGLHRTLAGDGLATSLAAMFGGPPNTTYGENIGVLAITRVFSIHVVAGAAALAVGLAFLGKVAALVATVPPAVLGGISIALFGSIAASGVRTLVEGRVDLSEKRNLLVASVILVLGVGGATVNVGSSWQLSPMALAAIAGIVLHAVIPGRELAGRPEDILGDSAS